MTRLTLLLAALLLVWQPVLLAQDKTEDAEKTANPLLSADFDEVATYVKANSVKMNSTTRIFLYSGNVEVDHGDMKVTSDFLEGKFNENNDIIQLVAKKNVVITKQETIRATSEKAVYDKSSETLTLSEGPELKQDDSILTADAIKIFLLEDRSVAEGQVRVKLVKQDEPGAKKKDGDMGLDALKR